MPETSTADLAKHPYRSILVLAWPQVIMMILHFMIGAVDVKVAGMLDAKVQAALGMMSQMLMFFLVVAIAVANGAVAAVSQSIGAEMHLRAKRYVGLCLVMALVLGAVILAASLPIRGLLLDAMHVRAQVRDVTDYFLSIYLLVIPAYYLLIITNAIFRAHKMVMQPLYVMAVITVLNGVGDYALGLGRWGMPDLGYKGMAWATFISISAGAAFNIFQLIRLGMLDRRSFAPWRWVRKAWPYLFKVAWPMAVMSMVWNSGYLVLFALTSSLPIGAEAAETVVAGLTVGNRIEALLFLPAFAFNMTASILVGHWLGAGRPDEAKRTGFRVLGMGQVSVGLATVALWLFVDPVCAYFSATPAVAAEAVHYLEWNMAAIPFTVVSMLLGGAFNGAGATLFSLYVFGSGIWLVRLPLAYILGHVVLADPAGVWIAMFVSQAFQAVIILAVYQYGNWQRFSSIKRPRNGVPAHATRIRPSQP